MTKNKKDKDNKNKEIQFYEHKFINNKRKSKIVSKVAPVYTCLKIIPDISILESQKTYYLAKTIFNFLNEDTMKILKRENGRATKIFKEIKFSFIIDMTSNNVFFYLICDNDYVNSLSEKFYNVFPNSKLEKVDYKLPNENILSISNNKLLKNKVTSHTDCIYQSLEYKYNDTLSLNIEDNLSNLEQLISNHNWLSDDDNVIIIYNLTHASKNDFNKKKSYYSYYVKQNQDLTQSNLLNNKLSIDYINDKMTEVVYKSLNFVTDTIRGVMGGYNDIIEEKSNKPKTNPFDVCNLFTKEKSLSPKLYNEIVIMSKSSDDKRRYENMNYITNSYDTLFLENELVPKKAKRPNLFDINFGNRKNIMSLQEIAKFLSLPYNAILEDDNNIEQIKVKQINSLAFLENGVFNLGIHEYRGNTKNLYIPHDYNSESLAYIPIAPQGSGKTTFLVNLVVNAINNNQSNVLIDYIKNCELSNIVLKHCKKKKPIVITAENISNLISMEFNEFDVPPNAPINLLASSINFKAEATENIINALNDKPLTANMSTIIYCACRIVYIKNGRGIGDFIEFLLNHEYRAELVNEVKDRDFDNIVFTKQINEALNVVEQLNEYSIEKDDEGNKYKILTGTNFNKINGIIARINKIKKSFLLSNMLYDCPKMNFVDLLDNGETIVVKLPEHIVSSDEKNVIATFIAMKTILATIKRGGKYDKPLRTNLWIDEVYQVPTVEDILHKYLSQLRKYGLKIILTVHRLSQLNNKKFQGELLGSGSSFSLLSGCKDVQIKDFEDRLGTFSYQDVYNLKPYSALHLIHSVKDGDWTGITQLPPELK